MQTVRWVSFGAVVWLGAGCTDDPPHKPVRERSCDELLSGPLYSESVPGHGNEDLTFDTDGFLVGADGGRNLWRVRANGKESLVLPNSGVDSGLRSMWWDGRLASAQYTSGAIFAIDPRTGSKVPMVSSLGLPTGIETGLDESIWFTEVAAGRVQRYHVPTDTLTVVADGFGKLQGLSFSPEYDQLYFAAIEESRIYVLDIDPGTMDATSEPRVFIEGAGASIDGLGVDICGNLYVGFWSKTQLVRYTADGDGPEILIDEPDADHALGNFAWGSEVGGWSPTTLYAVETGRSTIRAIDLGVREKPRPSMR